MCSPASAILVSIVTTLGSFKTIMKWISVIINFRSQFQGNLSTINFTSKFESNCLPQALKNFKIASKLTSIVTILANIARAGEHIFQVLGQYS